MNLMTEVEEPLMFDELTKSFSKINIDLEEKDKNNFFTVNIKNLKKTQKVF